MEIFFYIVPKLCLHSLYCYSGPQTETNSHPPHQSYSHIWSITTSNWNNNLLDVRQGHWPLFHHAGQWYRLYLKFCLRNGYIILPFVFVWNRNIFLLFELVTKEAEIFLWKLPGQRLVFTQCFLQDSSLEQTEFWWLALWKKKIQEYWIFYNIPKSTDFGYCSICNVSLHAIFFFQNVGKYTRMKTPRCRMKSLWRSFIAKMIHRSVNEDRPRAREAIRVPVHVGCCVFFKEVLHLDFHDTYCKMPTSTLILRPKAMVFLCRSTVNGNENNSWYWEYFSNKCCGEE